jgi:hypothetical protein
MIDTNDQIVRLSAALTFPFRVSLMNNPSRIMELITIHIVITSMKLKIALETPLCALLSMWVIDYLNL